MRARTKRSLFLSSTKEDLGAYRAVAVHVGYRLGMDVIAMEDFGPDTALPVDVCKKKVRSADIFLGLYAHRYGFQPDGLSGKSMIELEYEWAIETGVPVLAFILDEDQLWPPKFVDGDDLRNRLRRLKARLQKQHTVCQLTTPEQLKADLFFHLPNFDQASAREEDAAEESVRDSLLARPPAPHVAHPYALLQTRNVVGRTRELRLLDDWISGEGANAGELRDVRLLCLVAVGGMGKSALTWKWFQEHAPNTQPPFDGRLWWSFYEQNAGFQQFVTAALAYCSRQSVAQVERDYPVAAREAALLELLDQNRFLLVLDGAERLLLAYSGMDFAHLTDDDLDARTANQVAGALGLKGVDPAMMAGHHRLRATIDPHAGNFLRKLAGVRAARILVTTRLFPSSLQVVTGAAVPGSKAAFLQGLQPEDAIALWREMGVGGSDEALSRLFATFGYYPLLIRALAGEVAHFRPAPGNLDAWNAAHPNFNPYTLPLVQVKSHVLAHALQGLDENARALLYTISAFRSPARYETLAALFGKAGKGWTTGELDQRLSDLEDRGLLGWDRVSNSYDLHPVVRGVVWSGMENRQKIGVHDSLRSHFEVIPTSEKKSMSVAEAMPVIELFNALVGLEKYAEAANLYFDRINHKVTFWNDGMLSLNYALLESLFPNGMDQPPTGLVNSTYAQMGHAYRFNSEFRQALNSYIHLGNVKDDLPSVTRVHLIGSIDFAGEVLALAGVLSKAMAFRSNAEPEELATAEYTEAGVAICEAIVGRFDDALARLSRLRSHEYFKVPNYLSSIYVLQGEWHKADVEDADPTDRCRAWLGLQMAGKVVEQIAPILIEARQKGWHEMEVECACILAEAYRQHGRLDEARTVLMDAWDIAERGPYRLLLAEANNVLSEIERDAGNLAASIAAAEEGFRQAWCEGPPFANHQQLQKAQRLLRQLGAPFPTTPPRDTQFDDLIERVEQLVLKSTQSRPATSAQRRRRRVSRKAPR